MSYINEIDFSEDFIILSEKDFEQILKLIEPNNKLIQELVKAFEKSIYDKEFIKQIIHNWSCQMIQFNYELTDINNDWFFVLMNELAPSEQNAFINQFIGDKKVVNKLNEIHTRNTEMTINHFKNNKYSFNEIHKLLSDMRCFVAIDNGDYNDEPETVHVKYISTRPTQECYIRNYKINTNKYIEFENEFKQIYPFINNRMINLLDVLNKWKQYFIYN